MPATVNDILEQKGFDVHTIDPAISVADALSYMHKLGVGCLPVIEDSGLIGIFTERDVLVRIVHAGLDPQNTDVLQAMTANPACIEPESTLLEAMDAATRHRCKHLPVVSGNLLVGLVSVGDLTRWLIDNQPDPVDQILDGD